MLQMNPQVRRLLQIDCDRLRLLSLCRPVVSDMGLTILKLILLTKKTLYLLVLRHLVLKFISNSVGSCMIILCKHSSIIVFLYLLFTDVIRPAACVQCSYAYFPT